MFECALMRTPYDHTATSGMSNLAFFFRLDIIFDTSEAVGGHLNEVIVEEHSHALMSNGI